MSFSSLNNPLTKRLSQILLLVICLNPLPKVMAEPLPVPNGHWPLDHRQPPGTAARWSGAAGIVQPGAFQAIRFELPVKGFVTVYSETFPQGSTLETPCVVNLEIGHVHRIRVHDLEGLPGVELYPSLELIDRVHTPAGKNETYAVPVELTLKELESVLQDRMLNKVVYVEDPRYANLLKREGQSVYTEEFSPRENLLKEADVRGRPLVIVRLGSRQISPQEYHLLRGTGGRIVLTSSTH